jgi:hypothetical protein
MVSNLWSQKRDCVLITQIFELSNLRSVGGFSIYKLRELNEMQEYLQERFTNTLSIVQLEPGTSPNWNIGTHDRAE